MVSHSFTCLSFLFLAVVLGLGQNLEDRIDSSGVSGEASADESSLDVENNEGDGLSGSGDDGQDSIENSEDILSLDEFSKSPAAQAQVKKEDEEINSETHLEEDWEFHEYFPPLHPLGDSTKNVEGSGDDEQEISDNSEEILSLEGFSKSPESQINQEEESLAVESHLEDDWELSKYLPPLYRLGDPELMEVFKETIPKTVNTEDEELHRENGLFHGMLGYEHYYPYSHESFYVKNVHANVMDFAQVRAEFDVESKKIKEEVEDVFTRLTELIEGKIAKLFEAEKIQKECVRSERRGRAKNLRSFRSQLMKARHDLISKVDTVNQAIELYEVKVDEEKEKEAKKLRDKKAKGLKQKEKGGDVIGKTFGMIKTLAKLPLLTGFESAAVESAMEIPKLAIAIKEMVDAFKGEEAEKEDDEEDPENKETDGDFFNSPEEDGCSAPKIPNFREK